MKHNPKFNTIQTSFDKESDRLYNWAIAEAKQRPIPLSWLGREAFDCLRLFGSIEAAQEAIDAVKRLQILLAWYANEIEENEACKALDTPDLIPHFREAIEAGKRLVR